LSVTGITRNSGDRLEHWITRAREYADEVVLLVDDSSTDDTYDLAREHADSVRLVEHPPFIEVFYDLALRHASGDWVLWLDDDEFMGQGLADTRDGILAAPDLTHFYLPYRWVIRDEHGAERWLTSFPWHPNPRPRLIRNVGSTYFHRGRLHSPLEIAGGGRILAPDEAVVYHLDLAWRTREEREAKVARYRGNNAPSCEEYYLYEDYAATATSEPVPEGLVREPRPEALARAQHRREMGPPAVERPTARVADEQARVLRFRPNPPLFSAEYLSSTTPTRVAGNRGYAVEVAVRNSSPVSWRSGGPETGRVQLSYHWLSDEHGVLLREGDRAVLDADVEPGATTTVLAGLWTPYDPGEYVLQWDLVAEGVSWFSERGVAPLSVPVTVTDDDRLLSRPRAVATLPPKREERAAPARAPRPGSEPHATAGQRARRVLGRARRSTTAALAAARAGTTSAPDVSPLTAAGNVVPIAPVRVLDTRDGSGVPGAPFGPVPAGGRVTLRVTDAPEIPDFAVGVVATVSVLEPDYHGFFNVLGGDGVASGAVSGYFCPGGPVATLVLTALDEGRLTVWLSDNFPGRAQLLIDVTGYLTP
jgi:hypothetical protein